MTFALNSGETDASGSWSSALEDRIDTSWRLDEWNVTDRLFTGKVGNLMTATHLCPVHACTSKVETLGSRCAGCGHAFDLRSRPNGFDASYQPNQMMKAACRRPPGARKGEFSLANLAPVVASEIVFGLQQRDQAGIVLVPSGLRSIVVAIPAGCESLLDLPADFPSRLAKPAAGVFNSLLSQIKRAHLEHSNLEPTASDVWDCALVGLLAAPNRRYISNAGTVDFRGIRQPWLREITKEYGRAVRPSTSELQRTVRSVTLASDALTLRSNGNIPHGLTMGDMSAIVDHFSALTNDAGTPISLSHRRAVLGWWRRLIEYGRQAGLMDQIPGTFAIDPRVHRMQPVDAAEDDITRTIPEHVIAQLDSHLQLLGAHNGFKAGGWQPDDFAAMYQTVYQLLRDTGRRPNEVVSLHRLCLEMVEGKPTLVYDNHKRRRLGRRLPIGESTAQIIRSWSKRRDTLPEVPGCEAWLFPTPGRRNRPRHGHVKAAHFTNRMFRIWADAMPALHDDYLERDGSQAVFDPKRITPYGFRHAYAQRHADAGTPVDVLRELMDHRSVDTTMGYYQVSLKRKSQATEIISRLAIDRHGNLVSSADTLSYEREAVAVPFGNCTEPSNVKAGGGHCPIRFQCAGCGFYRPDPSYIPAIEQHIAQLRSDKETALAADAAPWVIDNLNAQIDAFAGTAATMKTLLDTLPPDERATVENAASELRKVRQSAAFIPLTVLARRGEQ